MTVALLHQHHAAHTVQFDGTRITVSRNRLHAGNRAQSQERKDRGPIVGRPIRQRDCHRTTRDFLSLGTPQRAWSTSKQPLKCFVEAPHASEPRCHRHFCHGQLRFMNELPGQKNTPSLSNRDRGCTKMLPKQSPQLTCADAKPRGNRVDVRLIQCAAFDQRQRTRHGVRRAPPSGELRCRFRPAAQARTKPGLLRCRS